MRRSRQIYPAWSGVRPALRGIYPPTYSPFITHLSPISPVYRSSQSVKRTFDRYPGFVEHMRVDHGGGHVGVPQQFLHGTDLMPRRQQMRGEGMPQHMGCHTLGQTRLLRGPAHGCLVSALQHMMPTPQTTAGIGREFPRWKYPLPLPED